MTEVTSVVRTRTQRSDAVTRMMSVSPRLTRQGASMQTNAIAGASRSQYVPGKRRWFSARRRTTVSGAAPRARRELRALALAVGDDVAPRVRDLLTAISLGAGSTVTQELGLPRQAFFVLEGRLAITVGEHPVAVLGPGSFFGETDTTRVSARNIPRVHALGPVVLGIAGHLELPEIHQLVPDLPTFALVASASDPEPIDPSVIDDDAMGLGVLQRIAG